jgi:hypothetical protein
MYNVVAIIRSCADRRFVRTFHGCSIAVALVSTHRLALRLGISS